MTNQTIWRTVDAICNSRLPIKCDDGHEILFIDREVINHHQRRCGKCQIPNHSICSHLSNVLKEFHWISWNRGKSTYSAPSPSNTPFSASHLHQSQRSHKISKSSGDKIYFYIWFYLSFSRPTANWAQSRTLAGVPPACHIESVFKFRWWRTMLSHVSFTYLNVFIKTKRKQKRSREKKKPSSNVEMVVVLFLHFAQYSIRAIM